MNGLVFTPEMINPKHEVTTNTISRPTAVFISLRASAVKPNSYTAETHIAASAFIRLRAYLTALYASLYA
jgi:hypothetical protein